MTWAGEAGADGSGLYIFTDDGSPQLVGGAEDQVLVFRNGVPSFDPQSTLTDIPGAGHDPKNLIQVALSGGDYTSVKSAIDYIGNPSGDRWSINIAPGVYVEQPFVLHSGVSLHGLGGVMLVAANSNSPFITATGVGLNSLVQNLIIAGPANSTALLLDNSQCIADTVGFVNYGVGIRTAGSFGYNIVVTSFGQTALSNSMYLEHTDGDLIMASISINGGDKFFDQSGGYLIVNNVVVKNVVSVLKFYSNDAVHINVLNVENAQSGICINSGSGVFSATAVVMKLVDGLHFHTHNEFTGSCTILSSKMEGDKVEVANFNYVNLGFFDEKIGDRAHRFYSELAVGSPEHGQESVFGEGDSYTRGMLVYTSGVGGGTLTDVTDEASRVNVSSFTFPGTSIDDSVYIASDLKDDDSGECLLWHGIKAKVDELASYGGGSIVTEIWNGSAWQEITTMSTMSDGEYSSSGILKFTMSNEQTRFNSIDVNSSWVRNDVNGDGIDRYWARFRIDSAITTSPVIDQIKLHTSRTELNADGYVEYFGNSRPVRSISWDISSAKPAADSPLDQDLYYSDSLDVGHTENKFSNNATDRFALSVYLPADIDTSTPLKFQWSWVTDDNTGGNTRWVVRWAVSSDGDSVYFDQAGAPNTAPGEKNTTEIVAQQNQYIQQTHSVYLDISNYIIGTSSLLWISIERDGGNAADTHGGDISIIQVEPRYLAWNNGNHTLGAY